MSVGNPLTGTELLLAGQENYAGQRHQLAIHEYGNPAGIPVIFVHGGPGSATSPEDAGYFDLDAYHVFLVDQRGTGKSLPRNCLEGNNSQNLLEDIEVIRKTLGLDKILLFGGSWGSTLSMLYAIKYPENVMGLILRGVFLAEKAGIEAFFLENSAAVKNHPSQWQDFLQVAFPEEQLRLTYNEAPFEDKFGILASALFEQIKRGNWKEVGAAYATWEVVNAVPPGTKRAHAIEWCQSDEGITMGLMEIYYIINKFWITEGFISSHADRLKGIPIKIAQGFNDDICPPAEQAFKLCAQLTNLNAGLPSDLVHIQVTDGGHSARSTSNSRVLQQFMKEFAAEFALQSKQTTDAVANSPSPSPTLSNLLRYGVYGLDKSKQVEQSLLDHASEPEDTYSLTT